MSARPAWLDPCLPEMLPWLTAAYPDEGCGLVVADADGQHRFVACENLADKYHRMDPQAFPRTARTFYILNPMAFVEAEDRGERVVAIVHSHADVGDYFSEEDVRAALMPRHSDHEPLEPAHPGVDYLVVSVRENGPDHATVFRFDEAAQAFPAIYGCEL